MIENTQILKEIKQAVLDVDPEAEVVLFGSRARGDFYDESDWDVLILVDKEESDFNFKRKIRKALYELELKQGTVISSVIINKKFWYEISVTPLYKEVEKDGIVLLKGMKTNTEYIEGMSLLKRLQLSLNKGVEWSG